MKFTAGLRLRARGSRHGAHARVMPLLLATCVWPTSTVSAQDSADEGAHFAYPIDARYDVRIPLRDDVTLSADVYVPEEGRAFPAVVTITPYNSLGTVNVPAETLDIVWRYVERGYAFVTVDVRGRFDSGGTWDPWRHDGEDGWDVIDWMSRQPWSNGRVATIGASYGGMNQWQIAAGGHPAHMAMVPYVAPASGFRDGVRFNGVPHLDLMFTWAVAMTGRALDPLTLAGWRWRNVMADLPLATLGERTGRSVRFWREAMEHDRMDAWWEPLEAVRREDDSDIPSFNVTGWWDGQVRGTTRHFMEAARRSDDPARHRLIIGPWHHDVNSGSMVGGRDFGPQAVIDLDDLRNQWLDHWLLDDTAPDGPSVRCFLQGLDEWRTADAWPIPGMRPTALYLASDGHANTRRGDGRLVWDGPTGPPDVFTYDPSDAVPSLSSRTAGSRGGISAGPVDNAAVEDRPDVLVYTSPPLSEGMEITGPVHAAVHIETDVPDTDITVKVLDVLPGGAALNVTHGVAREVSELVLRPRAAGAGDRP